MTQESQNVYFKISFGNMKNRFYCLMINCITNWYHEGMSQEPFSFQVVVVLNISL